MHDRERMASERTSETRRRLARVGGEKKRGESTPGSVVERSRGMLAWQVSHPVPILSLSSSAFSFFPFLSSSFLTLQLSLSFSVLGPSLNSSHFVSSSLCPFHRREPISTNSPGKLWKGVGKRWRRKGGCEERERERRFSGVPVAMATIRD